MKLKKIASLALVGIMAVSMLTACGEGTGNGGENGNGEEVTPSASYTVTVLGDTSDVTQAKLSASSSTTLDKAVAFVANNYTIASNAVSQNLSAIPNGWNQVTAVENIMLGATYKDNMDTFSFAPASYGEKTYWIMYHVSRAMTDEYITEQIADKLDDWAVSMVNDDEIVDNATWDYTVSVAKADCLAGNEPDRAKDSVIVGVAVTLTKTDVKYN
ncbi:hypothetical protein B5G12_10215 [Faecalibacterium sp. An58]|uniref:hypothetical protein n=1 Tax=Faecalibacterium sp. An58 TaxID=1965648 RepID=UPI000B3A1F54|nr:hypothetical protein [Faecalibacterium sp. An58]OUN70919.1 hypothetical protein B5G12_10215 [Faecalibacterium sp. An58]